MLSGKSLFLPNCVIFMQTDRHFGLSGTLRVTFLREKLLKLGSSKLSKF